MRTCGAVEALALPGIIRREILAAGWTPEFHGDGSDNVWGSPPQSPGDFQRIQMRDLSAVLKQPKFPV
jgi:hypothetical protein